MRSRDPNAGGLALRDAIRTRLLRLLRVPPDPAPPPGDPAQVRTFRAAPSFFRYSVALWAFKQLSAAVGLFVSYLFVRGITAGVGPFAYLGLVERFFILVYVIQLPFSYALLRLDFELRWYILSDRSLRIREGILSVREKTMTFANIQNIAIRQNPLQRLFGIATVVVRAAGGGAAQASSGGGGRGSHEATFEGVDNGEHIRDAIRARIRLHRDAGLGDPGEPEPDEASAIPARLHNRPVAAVGAPARPNADAASVLAAANRLLDEARALRRTR